MHLKGCAATVTPMAATAVGSYLPDDLGPLLCLLSFYFLNLLIPLWAFQGETPSPRLLQELQREARRQRRRRRRRGGGSGERGKCFEVAVDERIFGRAKWDRF